MFDGLLYAALYGFLLAFAIGPVFFTLIETSITKGFKAGLFFDLGAQTADIIFILIAYFSTSKILERVKDDPGLLIFGGAVLIAYGIISYIRTAKSFIKIVREHYAVNVKKDLGGLFLKGFLLNFVNFGVLAGWIGTIIMANALTTSENGVFFFLATVLATFFLTDLLKIFLAKKLKSKMTPRFIYKTKKWVSILILIFGVMMLLQGVFPDEVQKGLDRIPNASDKIENMTK
ncbi:LysE family translocator [Aureisphaera sp. CAU 1614]|uniref:LysE family translocator n=1 Tax=Halomarinibacterium sedimenti TaxID=2857106 RepID=A0A9X1FMX0_9FLAO|nr:LysE family transporter [Halomarinibacterium sedimenti]MAL60549.1 lysine transporter LysE [Flavobacteriaceae bacterium]MBW2937275.1 LysE family translocator [Halomarinibacterium sedimenti]|tara:strand:- start:82 stop:777 length:696 start_codon:yes stop_codon:yes gene_type:complete